MAFIVFMVILHLYSDPCFCQSMRDAAAVSPRSRTGMSATGVKCSKCIVGSKAPESVCSECTRERDNADKPFTCRRCKVGISPPQPFICRRCFSTNSNLDINSWSDGLTTVPSREQRLAELRRLIIENGGAHMVDRLVEAVENSSIESINEAITFFESRDN